MRKTIRCLAALMMTIMIFSVPIHALPEAGQANAAPARKQMEIELEGMTEDIEVTQYIHEGSFSVWYDAAKLVPVPVEKGVMFEPIGKEPAQELYFSILDISEPGRTGRPDLDIYQKEYERQGWTLEALGGEGMFPLLGNDKASVQAFLARKGTEFAQVYLSWDTQKTYLCTAWYPQEAAEGWGARMIQMLSTLEYPPEQ